MSNGPGTPPKGESASLDVAPFSQPIEASDVDAGWLDEPEPTASPIEVGASKNTAVAPEAAPEPARNAAQAVRAADPAKPGSSILPQSLSPVVLSNAAGPPNSEPPAAEAAAAKTAEKAHNEARRASANPSGRSKPGQDKVANVQPTPKPDKVANAQPIPKPDGAAARVVPRKEAQQQDTLEQSKGARAAWFGKTRNTYVVASVAILAVGSILLLLRPKHEPKVTPLAAEPTVAPSMPAAAPITQDTAARVGVTASAEPPETTVPATDSSAVPPPPAASAAPSASAASSDSFSDAFVKTAAKKDAKWAEIKPRSGKAESAAAASSKTPAAKSTGPTSSDPLDLLKRLEEARKNKKP
jgi:hypothetical protein